MPYPAVRIEPGVWIHGFVRGVELPGNGHGRRLRGDTDLFVARTPPLHVQPGETDDGTEDEEERKETLQEKPQVEASEI